MSHRLYCKRLQRSDKLILCGDKVMYRRLYNLYHINYMDDYAKNSSHHDSPKDRGHQSDGIIPCKNRLSRDFNIIREISDTKN